MAAEPIHGDKVALWYCIKCHHSGALRVADSSVYDTIDALKSHHEALSKSLCSAPIGTSGVRLIKPTEWHATVRIAEVTNAA